MSQNSLLSGSIGIPDGAYRLMNDPIQRAVEQIVKNELEIRNIIQQGTGSGNVLWLRANAAGTKLAGSSDLTCSRTGEGTYLITSAAGFTSSGGYYQIGVVATPSAISGNGGDGTNSFKAYAGNTQQDTDDASDGVPVYYSPYTGKLYSGGTTDDDIYIHDPADWGSAPTQVDVGANLRTGTDGDQILCMSQEGRYLWISSATAVDLRAMDLSDNSILVFTDSTQDELVYAAKDSMSSATRIWARVSGAEKRYTPNMGTQLVGASDISYTAVAYDVDSVARNAIWQDSNYFWHSSSKIWQVSTTADTTLENALPTLDGYAAPSNSRVFAIDSVRRRLFVFVLYTDWHLLVYSGWQDGAVNTGTWTHVRKLGSGSSFHNVGYYDPVSDVLMVVDKNAGDVYRFVGDPLTYLDVVDLYPGTFSHIFVGGCYYSEPYGYIAVRVASTNNKIARLNYTGDDLTLGSGGGTVVSSILHAQYQITSATQAYVYLFRSLSPPIRADGEFSVHIAT